MGRPRQWLGVGCWHHTHGAIPSEPDELSDLKTKHCLVAIRPTVSRSDRPKSPHSRSNLVGSNQICPMVSRPDRTTPASADKESLQAKWVDDLGELSLRGNDIYPLIHRAKQYWERQEDDPWHPILLPVDKPHTKLLLRLVIAIRKRSKQYANPLNSTSASPNVLRCSGRQVIRRQVLSIVTLYKEVSVEESHLDTDLRTSNSPVIKSPSHIQPWQEQLTSHQVTKSHPTMAGATHQSPKVSVEESHLDTDLRTSNSPVIKSPSPIQPWQEQLTSHQVTKSHPTMAGATFGK
ncbi:hypothetical protein GWK47_019453 [Chionoecetes opilio]|uniref:Uncharacterized protein n=1 Tax=Chionoecetes opilio TaxID=41210 RepID=A0A8J4XSC9_CHIOP|nr:hypothetical protein GWK47_019453 [Chionoecetes opilio]